MIYPTSKQKFSLSTLNANFKELEDGKASISSVENINTAKLDKTGDSKDNTTTFTEATVLANILTTESHATLFGKIMKFFTFIGTTGLTTTATTITTAINELVTRVLVLETNATTSGTVATPANVSTVTQHYVSKKSGIVQYVLRATCTMTSGTSYTIETLPVGYRPAAIFYKNIEMRDTSTVLGSLTITTAGVVSIIPRTTISAQLISINEMFIV